MAEHPIKPPIDDMETVRTEWGVMQFWKARALALGEIQRIINDAAESLEDDHDDVPAKPTADPAELPPPLAADNVVQRTDPELIKQLEAACDRLSARLDRIEAGCAAAQALDDLENCVDAELEQEQPPKH